MPFVRRRFLRTAAFCGTALGALVLGLWPIPACAAERIKIRDLYSRGAEFSEAALALSGKEVSMRGFMAPPLKPDSSFFVLTKMPMAVCPFCDSEINWPLDIVLVRLASSQDWVDFNRSIEVDGGTGFVSRVRLVDAAFDLVG